MKSELIKERDRLEDCRNENRILKQKLDVIRQENENITSQINSLKEDLSEEKGGSEPDDRGMDGKELNHNLVEEQLVQLEENLMHERDRNQILKNEIKVLKQQKKSQSSMEEDINNIRKEMHLFHKSMEDRLNTLSKHSSQSSISSMSSMNEKVSKSKGKKDTSPKQQPSSQSKSSASARESVLFAKSNTLRFGNNSQQTRELHPNEVGHRREEDTVEKEKLVRIQKLRERREKQNRKTLIFGSSLAKSINRQLFNDQLEMGSADIHPFPGKTAKKIVEEEMLSHLERECPHTVVFVAGGNDIPRRRATTKELKDIAGHLIQGGLTCRNNYGVSKVFIASILPRAFGEFQGNRHMLNQILEEMCLENDFKFIDNSDVVILRNHVSRDGVHLNSSGCRVLTDNILCHLNA